MTRPAAASEPAALVAGLPIVLACAWPFVQFYNHNRAETAEWATIVLGFAVSAIVAIIGYALLRLLFPSTRRSRHASLVIVLCLPVLQLQRLRHPAARHPGLSHGRTRLREATLRAAALGSQHADRAWLGLVAGQGAARMGGADHGRLCRPGHEPRAVGDGASSRTEAPAHPLRRPRMTQDRAATSRLNRTSISSYWMPTHGTTPSRPSATSTIGPSSRPWSRRGFVNLDRSFSNYPKDLSLPRQHLHDGLPRARRGKTRSARRPAITRCSAAATTPSAASRRSGYRFLTAARSTSYCIGFEDVCVRGDRDIGLVSIGELEVRPATDDTALDPAQADLPGSDQLRRHLPGSRAGIDPDGCLRSGRPGRATRVLLLSQYGGARIAVQLGLRSGLALRPAPQSASTASRACPPTSRRSSA